MKINLEFLRKKINNCDIKLLGLLEERFYWVENVASVKNQTEVPFRDIEREKAIISNMKKQSKTLSPEFIEMLYILIFGENENHVKDKVRHV